MMGVRGHAIELKSWTKSTYRTVRTLLLRRLVLACALSPLVRSGDFAVAVVAPVVVADRVGHRAGEGVSSSSA